MSTLEILKRLSVAAVDVSKVSCGGKQALTQAEVASLLAGASMPLMLFAYARELQSDQDKINLAIHVHRCAKGMVRSEEWKIVKAKDIVRTMAYMAVYEAISPGICRRCKGPGYIANKACPCCHGSGRKPLSDRTRAKLIGITQQAFSQCWSIRYQRIYNYVMSLEAKLKEILMKNSQDEGG